jgi:sec-independent protein translocase protein TatB
MFEVGFTELLLIFALALIVLGPEKLPRVASQVGRWIGRARSLARQFREQLEDEVDLTEPSTYRRAPFTSRGEARNAAAEEAASSASDSAQSSASDKEQTSTADNVAESAATGETSGHVNDFSAASSVSEATASQPATSAPHETLRASAAPGSENERGA